MMMLMKPALWSAETAINGYDLDLSDGRELEDFMMCIDSELPAPNAHAGCLKTQVALEAGFCSESTSGSTSAETVSASAAPPVIELPTTHRTDCLSDDSIMQQLQKFSMTAATVGNAQRGVETAAAVPVSCSAAEYPDMTRDDHTEGRSSTAVSQYGTVPSWSTLQRSKSLSAAEAAAASSGDAAPPNARWHSAVSTTGSFTAPTRPLQGGPGAVDMPMIALVHNTLVGAPKTTGSVKEQQQLTQPLTTPTNHNSTHQGVHAAANIPMFEQWLLQHAAESGTWRPVAAAKGTEYAGTPPKAAQLNALQQTTAAAVPYQAPNATSRKSTSSADHCMATARRARTPVAAAASLPAKLASDPRWMEEPRICNSLTEANDSVGLPEQAKANTRRPGQLQRFEDLVMHMFLQQRASIDDLHAQQQPSTQPCSNGSPSSGRAEVHGAVACHSSHAATARPPVALAAPTAPNANGSSPFANDCNWNNSGMLNPCNTSNISPSRPQPNHSTIEKQRRDRLNSLIEELAALVPPADPRFEKTPSSRRPKHTVLADTINLIRAMQLKLQLDQSMAVPAAEGGTGGDGLCFTTRTDGAAGVEQVTAVMSKEHSVLQGQRMDKSCDVTASSSLTIEHSLRGTLLIKVTCRDWPGLLADVLNTLKAVPVVIVGANATTAQNGMAHHTFEVRIEDGSVTPELIHGAVQDLLFGQERATLRGKRPRRFDWGN